MALLLILRTAQDGWRARDLLPLPLCQPLTDSGAEASVVSKQFLIINSSVHAQVETGCIGGCIVGV